MFERIIEISNPFLVIFSVMSKTSSSAFAYKPEFDKKKKFKSITTCTKHKTELPWLLTVFKAQ